MRAYVAWRCSVPRRAGERWAQGVRSRTRQLPQPRFAQVAGITSDKFVPKYYHIIDTGGVLACRYAKACPYLPPQLCSMGAATELSSRAEADRYLASGRQPPPRHSAASILTVYYVTNVISERTRARAPPSLPASLDAE